MIIALLISRGDGSYSSMSFMIIASMIQGLHVLIVGGLAIFYFLDKKGKELGKAWALSGLAVLIVGFSACLGGASL